MGEGSRRFALFCADRHRDFGLEEPAPCVSVKSLSSQSPFVTTSLGGGEGLTQIAGEQEMDRRQQPACIHFSSVVGAPPCPRPRYVCASTMT